MPMQKEALHLALRIALVNSPSDRRGLLLVDQAEEVFTLSRDTPVAMPSSKTSHMQPRSSLATRRLSSRRGTTQISAISP